MVVSDDNRQWKIPPGLVQIMKDIQPGCLAEIYKASIRPKMDAYANNDWTIPHLVAIQYTDVPDESADLVFINVRDNNITRGNHCYEYPAEKQYLVKSKTGRLVCHNARFLHGTTVHKSHLPRTCLVIEVGFPPLNKQRLNQYLFQCII